MALAAKLQMRQSQGLVMTPQLMQSIRLLQFTHHELERFIDDEIEKNPLIERSEEQAAGEAAEASVQALEEGAEWFEGDLVATSDVIAGAFDSSLENVFPDDPGPEPRLAPDLTLQWRSSGQGGGSADGFDPDDTAARPRMGAGRSS
jgi:RNA polymerase sigma-54 factor